MLTPVRAWVLAALLGRGLVSWAASMPGLFNTGVGAANNLLPGGTLDPHWRLAASPDATAPGPAAYVVRDGYPIPPWLGNGPQSKWIAPRSDQSEGNAPGNYAYQLAFDLTGFDATTAVLTGRWSSDNSGLDVRLNGESTGLTFDGNFGSLSPEFRIASGFVEGTNLLEFVVNNAGDGINPTGFRAELGGTIEPLPPPGIPPTITAHPADVTVQPAEAASFKVTAGGSRPLRYQWRLDGSPLADASEAVLTIPSVAEAWLGRYDAVVRNDWGAVTSRVATLSLRASRPDSRTYEPLGPSSRRTGISLSEIMYHPAAHAAGLDLRFIELYNSNPFFEDLSGWRLAGDVDFTFPEGTVLAGNAFLVVAPDPAALRSEFGLTNVIGGFSPDWDHGPGTLRLRKRSGAVLLEVRYSDEHPWPVAADGFGHSLVLARPSYGEANPHSWAASVEPGGSPGSNEPVDNSALSGLVLNELLAHTPHGQAGFLEVRNVGLVPADLSGCRIRFGLDGPGQRIPEGTRLSSGGILSLNLEFDVPSRGGTLWLQAPDNARVLDVVRVGGQLRAFSSGRSPEGSAWGLLDHPTPGLPNSSPHAHGIRINELLFHPPGGNEADEFIELLNTASTNLSLAGWRFTDGIEYSFPEGAVIKAGGYGIVSPDRGRFLALNPAAEPGSVWGDSEGSLDNGGERVALARPVVEVISTPAGLITNRVEITVAEVTYRDGGRWGRWSDGGGSSLELRDPRTDGSHGPDWADSDETLKAPWTLIEANGPLSLVHPGVPQADQLQILLLGAGEVLVDDVEVLVDGNNRVNNATFEGGTAGWFFQGTHRLSRGEAGEGYQSGRSLRVVASERGDHVANRVRTTLKSPIAVGTRVTLRARARWLCGHPEILLRLRNGGLEASARLERPACVGTPGAPNSRAVPNAGPAISLVAHRPVLPAAGEAVRVTARVADPDGVGEVWLNYRLDPSTTIQSSRMVDDGTGGDELAGDGCFTASVPGQARGALIAFWIEADDAASPPASARFPGDAPGRESLVRFGETTPPGALGTYHVWLTRAAHDHWATREKMSNEDVDATFVSSAGRVIYNAGAHYSGSSYTSPGYDSPTGGLCGYDLRFPKDDGFLGDTRLTLDWPIRDDTDQREQLMFWFLDQFGLPNMYRRYVHLFVNGVRRGTIYDDVQQPGDDTVSEWFPDDDDGTLWKTDCWNEFDNVGNRIDPCILNTLERFPSSGPLKPARYRWNWRPRAVEDSADDFNDLFALVEAMTTTSNYLATVTATVDVDHWMRTFAMNDLASFWDAFGNPNAKNTFLYKPRREGWKLFCWDFDVGLGVFNDPPNAPLFDVNDPTVRRLYQTPAFVRRYWAALEEALGTFFNSGDGGALDALLDARYAGLRANQVNVAGPASIKSWILQRRTFLQTQLRAVRANFAIATRNGQDFASEVSPVTLAGVAPVAVRTLRVNGIPFEPSWTTVTNWMLQLPLTAGTNSLLIEGLDRLAQPVAGARATLQIVYTGPAPPPDLLVINEWMAANTRWPDPADGAYDDWFELFNPGTNAVALAGWRLTDDPDDPARFVVPAGYSVPARGCLLVWADGQPEQSRPGGDLHVNFRLRQEGEQLLLFNPAGQRVDAVHFGAQAEDVSEGRWPDLAPEPYYAMTDPSPGESNPPPASWPGIRLLTARVGAAGVHLEWSADPGRTYQVFFAEVLDGSTAWKPASPAITSADRRASFEDETAPVEGRRFYQVQLLRPWEPPEG